MSSILTTRVTSRRKIFQLLLFMLLIAFTDSMAQSNRDVIFLLDQSASMKTGGLFGYVKSTLKEYVTKCEIGDRVILIGFESDVAELADQEIRQASDVTELLTRVDALQAPGKWTYMTKALDRAAKRLSDLQKAYPLRSKVVYVLTDGYNDPPPQTGPAISFEDILQTHFQTFTRERTYVYVLSLPAVDGVRKPSTQDSAQKRFFEKVQAVQTERIDTQRELLTLEPLSLKIIDSTGRAEFVDSIRFRVGVANLQGPIRLTFGCDQGCPAQVAVSNRVTATAVGQVLEIPLKIDMSKVNDQKNCKVEVTADRSIQLTNSAFDLEITKLRPIVVRETPLEARHGAGQRLFYLGGLVVILAVVILTCRFRGRFDPDLTIELANEGRSIRPSNERKLCGRPLLVNKDIDLDAKFGERSLRLKSAGKGHVAVTLLEMREDVRLDDVSLKRGEERVVSVGSLLKLPSGGTAELKTDVQFVPETIEEEEAK